LTRRSTPSSSAAISSWAVEQFEAEFAAFIGTRHAVAVGTGLAAIELALRAFGIGPGDEVITAANTFIATILAIAAVGATPVLVDMDRESYTIDPAAIAAAVGRHRFGPSVRAAGRPRRRDGGRGAAQPAGD
jgi:dTDP-4-amino-4,6-dideoxygalactose transaminase